MKGHCIVQQALSRNVTSPHEKFPCEFVNTDFLLSSCSFSLHVHSGFPFPGGGPRQRKSSQPLSPAWSLPCSFLPGTLGITLVLGLLSSPGGWGLLYPVTASSVQVLNGKSWATVLLMFLGCSIAPGLFLICFFGANAILKVGAVFALNAGVWDVLWVLLTPSCWSNTLLSQNESSPLNHSALTKENMHGTVGAAGSWDCDPLCHPLLLVHFS